jgi:putative ABC transport system substrate-binding protein
MAIHIRRRELIATLGVATVWPLGARAQQPVPGIPRLIYFPNAFPDDVEQQARRKAFRDAFEKLGWADGPKIRIEEHWGRVPTARMRSVAAEFVRSAPAVIVTAGTPPAEALGRESRTVPVVFVAAGDPLSSGLVDSMAHPGGNLTGFINYENSMGGKWLGLLKEAAPAVRRVLVARIT